MVHSAQESGMPRTSSATKYGQHEGAAAVLGRQSGESQIVANSHGRARHRHDDADPRRPLLAAGGLVCSTRATPDVECLSRWKCHASLAGL